MLHYPIGWALRPHGLRGELVLKLFRARRFSADGERRAALHLVRFESDDGRCEDLRLTRVRFTDPSTVVVKLEGVDEREAAEALVGATLRVDPASAPSALLDEADRLIDAWVFDEVSGAEVGRVGSILDNGAQAVLVVGAGDDEVLIPFVPAIVVAVLHREDPAPSPAPAQPSAPPDASAPPQASAPQQALVQADASAPPQALAPQQALVQADASAPPQALAQADALTQEQVLAPPHSRASGRSLELVVRVRLPEGLAEVNRKGQAPGVPRRGGSCGSTS